MRIGALFCRSRILLTRSGVVCGTILFGRTLTLFVRRARPTFPSY